MEQQIVYCGNDYTGLVDYIQTTDTPEHIAEILEDMVYTFAIERLESQIIGKDDAESVIFMRYLIEAVRSIKPVEK